MTDYEFEGWVGEDEKAANGNMRWKEFEPKTWEETGVDIRVTHCGVCGSDSHVLPSGWGPTKFPCVVGHEIVGVAVRVGSQATGNIKVGDVVGVVAQSDAYEESYCAKGFVETYNSIHHNGDKGYGGYASYHRAPSHFVFRIPQGLAPEHAAPVLCGGATVYSLLKHFGAGPGKKVGVIGLGGLGHFAVLFAKALGCESVAVISRTSEKREEAFQMGADTFIATGEDDGWASSHAQSLDIVVSTVASTKIPLTDYLSLLPHDGTLVQAGVPEEPIPSNAIPLIAQRRRIVGSLIANPMEIQEMLELAAQNQLKPWVEKVPMKDANKAIVDIAKGYPRYRYVLVN